MTEETSVDQKKIDSATRMVLNVLAEGGSIDGFKEVLLNDGIPEEEVDRILASCQNVSRADAKDDLARGLFFFAAGLTIFLASFFLRLGGWVVIPYGAVVVGTGMFISGIIRWRRHRKRPIHVLVWDGKLCLLKCSDEQCVLHHLKGAIHLAQPFTQIADLCHR